MIERVFATVRLKSYEQTNVTIWVPISTLLCWINGALGAYLAMNSKFIHFKVRLLNKGLFVFSILHTTNLDYYDVCRAGNDNFLLSLHLDTQ